MEEYLLTFHGVNGTSLLYMVRKKLVPMAEADDPLNRYDTIVEVIIARSSIVVAGTFDNTAAL